MTIETIETRNHLNLNNINIFSSEKMLEKIEEGGMVFFTVPFSNLQNLISIFDQKGQGKTYPGMEPFYIEEATNDTGYFDMHVEKSIPMFTDRATVQLRARRDKKGVNLFFTHRADCDISHEILLNTSEKKDEYYNELHLKSEVLDFSIVPIEEKIPSFQSPISRRDPSKRRGGGRRR